MEHDLCFYRDVKFFLLSKCNKGGIRSTGIVDCMHDLLFKSGGCFEKDIK